LPRPKKSFSPEFKEEAVKMVIETSRPIARVARELGINEGTLGNWVGIPGSSKLTGMGFWSGYRACSLAGCGA
jgi:hypothetical protein